MELTPKTEVAPKPDQEKGRKSGPSIKESQAESAGAPSDMEDMEDPKEMAAAGFVEGFVSNDLDDDGPNYRSKQNDGSAQSLRSRVFRRGGLSDPVMPDDIKRCKICGNVNNQPDPIDEGQELMLGLLQGD